MTPPVQTPDPLAEVERALREFDALQTFGRDVGGGIATVLRHSDVLYVLLHLRARLRESAKETTT